MQAIETRYVGATATRNARIVAECKGRRIVREYDDYVDDAGNHARAAMDLVAALGWGAHGVWISGVLKSGNVAWVCSPEARS